MIQPDAPDNGPVSRKGAVACTVRFGRMTMFCTRENRTIQSTWVFLGEDLENQCTIPATLTEYFYLKICKKARKEAAPHSIILDI
jgi:hypothetical protein